MMAHTEVALGHIVTTCKVKIQCHPESSKFVMSTMGVFEEVSLNRWAIQKHLGSNLDHAVICLKIICSVCLLHAPCVCVCNIFNLLSFHNCA